MNKFMNTVRILLVVVAIAACSSTPKQIPELSTLVAALQAADVSYRKGDLKAAEQTYRIALSIDPQSVEANIRLGVIAHLQGEYARAEQYFKQVLIDDPRNETAAYNLAVLHVEQANTMFDRFLALSS